MEMVGFHDPEERAKHEREEHDAIERLFVYLGHHLVFKTDIVISVIAQMKNAVLLKRK